MSDDLINIAVDYGSNIGQVALAEFILKSYAGECTPILQVFLQKVCDNGYESIGKVHGKSGEDIALQVTDVVGGQH